ncbi:MAG: DUF6116 family protein [Arenimonas sp.]
MSNPLLGPILGYASRLRFPTLFLVIAMLFVFDLVIPDFIPFLDEILLGLGTVLLASWKNRKTPIEKPNDKPPIEGEFKKD